MCFCGRFFAFLNPALPVCFFYWKKSLFLAEFSTFFSFLQPPNCAIKNVQIILLHRSTIQESTKIETVKNRLIECGVSAPLPIWPVLPIIDWRPWGSEKTAEEHRRQIKAHLIVTCEFFKCVWFDLWEGRFLVKWNVIVCSSVAKFSN
jgi:hypothetical protein